MVKKGKKRITVSIDECVYKYIMSFVDDSLSKSDVISTLILSSTELPNLEIYRCKDGSIDFSYDSSSY